MKLTAYRCDRCGEWVEELKVTHALVNLKGKRNGRYLQDLCEGCTEKVIPSDTEPAAETRITLPSGNRDSRRRRNPEQIAEALQVGRAMLAAGKSLQELCVRLVINERTWSRWERQAALVSASRSASSPNSQPADEAKSGV